MMRKALTIFGVLSLGAMLLFARHDTESRTSRALSLYKSLTGAASRSMSNIGNWAYWIYDDGMSAITPGGGSGGIYPTGTAAAIFTDGLVWGGIVEGDDALTPRVGGQTYRIGTIGGWVETWGPGNTNPTAIPASDERIGIYRIRSDWRTLSPPQVAQDVSLLEQKSLNDVSEADAQGYIDNYAWNWMNWPTDLGAPYIDVNENGIYDPVLDDNGYPIAADGDYPGIANADQVIWFVVNDLDASRTTFMYGSQPIGLELQITLWAYNQPGARLGQIVFKKFKFINVSGKTINDMYVGQWSDPDVGNFTDDVVGCDIDLSLGFAYSGFATDDDYDGFDLAPAAVGYDFFQGPIVESPGDTAIFDLKPKPGYKNLGMTSFGWFAAGGDIGDPDLGVYDGTLQWYNLLQGNLPENDLANPKFYHEGNDPSAPATKYPLSGDPVLGTGDIDGLGLNVPPSDRRLVLCSGPFTMAPGDTQEVVVAVVGGMGDDNLTSVADMKLTDAVAQSLYDDLFKSVPKAPAAPKVTGAPFEGSVVLNWGYDAAAVELTEETVIANYAFEGYNVYQLPNATAGKDQAELIATYDLVNGVMTIEGKRFLPQYGQEVIVPVQFGTDKGVRRYLSLDKDYITGLPLHNGTTYYYAVTAYNYNADPQLIEDQALESPLIVTLVTVQGAVPGTEFKGSVGELITIAHPTGASDGQVEVQIIDPAALTGHIYEIFFVEDTDTNSATYGELLWSISDKTAGTTVVSGQIQEATLGASDAQPIFDGIQVKVTGPALDFKDFQTVQNAAGPIDPPEGAAADFQGFPSLRPTDGQQVGAGHWFIHTWPNGSRASYDAFFARTLSFTGGNGEPNQGIAALIPDDFEIRFTETGSEAYDYWWITHPAGGFVNVPFELWNIGDVNDPTDDFQLLIYHYDLNENGVFDMQVGAEADHETSGGDNDPYTDPFYWMIPDDDTPGTQGYDNLVAGLKADNSVEPSWLGGPGTTLADGSPGAWAGPHRMVLVNWNGGDVMAATSVDDYNQALPETGTIFRIVTSKPNTITDVFSFATPKAVVADADSAKLDVAKINVFPNPYYAHNPQEANRFDRFVTFNHLPPFSVSKTTIRIFNLSGVQVRKFVKEDESQFLRWDLANDSGLPVGSGIYIAYIDMPKLNKQKVLKVFIIQSKQILEYY